MTNTRKFSTRKATRLAAAMVAMTAVAAAMLATPANALPINTPAAGVVTMTPAAGTGASTFGFTLPGGAACTGDSSSGGYRVQTFISNAPDTSQLTFDGTGAPVLPVGVTGYAQPLSNGGAPASNMNTAAATTAGGPGAILIAGTVLDSLNTLFPQPTASGVYKIGVACSLGTAITSFYEKTIFVTVTAGNVTAYSNFAVSTAPTLSALTPGNGTLSGTLTAPTPVPTPAVINYTITAVPTAGATVTLTVAAAGAFTLTGLTNGVQYSVTATANNGANSAPSTPAQLGTPSDPNSLPGVGNLTGVPGTNSVVLNWTTPAGAAPTGYTVALVPNVGGPFTAAAGAVTYTVSGLTAGTMYTFTVTPIHALPLFAASASTQPISPLSAQSIIQDITVTRPAGALVLTQVCGVYGALDGELASTGFPALAPKGATTAPGGATGPTLLADGAGGVDPNYTNGLYPSPANPSYPTHCGISLGTATLVTSGAAAGQFYASDGQINQVTVSDTRDGQNGWTLNGTMSSFINNTNSSQTFGGNWLGWTPKVNGFSAGQVVTAGSALLPNNPGLAAPSTLASATTASLGVAQLDARLKLLIPVSVPSGTYKATLTFSFV